ncbi:MAG TPA: polyisoprenoid-binding protein [Chloroflexus aurantiacus]|jgi:polyisoprenoid-binding protein YceI|uniref:YceI family protein n=1 Tax=Chloroflexus aurantiacus (strain ATCC 29366 / DSM 635 / J-10-fl) TaxID=324602 RepID=A9WD71_CHLAA|nr:MULTISPECIES: YceI family protein [Chloroflexus]ABY35038.1 YceI family protein [Chloroflexus aurantiacus J-10-fl]RMG49649.1 MAG: polyisoprenoid-binding protein [Chloroflexota bacterium]GIV95141.1 MAG: polyisoprenoid-binding protein [Chloroflexus sp.]HBW68747.1 polyisoprenoid-binding protein [Chloroflexus aurantiacus]
MTWVIDASHSTITFSVRHMMISKVRGRFTRFDGTVDFDEQNPTNSKVQVTIDASSIDTRDERRDGHLMSPDFLDVANYPTLTFVSKRVEVIDESHGRIIGDLTIRGVSREVTLDVEYNGQSKSPWGTISAGFSATTKINRKDWGLTWNVALETGGVLVGEEVTIEIEIEIVKQVPQEESVAA